MNTRTRYGRSAGHEMEAKKEIEVNGTIEQIGYLMSKIQSAMKRGVKTYLVQILNGTTSGSQC